jgi:hypothetical protein
MRELLSKIDDATRATLETDDLMQKLQAYNDRTIKNARDWQSKIRACLQDSHQIMTELEEKLPIKS